MGETPSEHAAGGTWCVLGSLQGGTGADGGGGGGQKMLHWGSVTGDSISQELGRGAVCGSWGAALRQCGLDQGLRRQEWGKEAEGWCSRRSKPLGQSRLSPHLWASRECSRVRTHGRFERRLSLPYMTVMMVLPTETR